jgi:site-specific DNA-methyltransferase (adenine-specific)
MVNVINGDSLNKLQNQDENTFDSCVTDPPYELGFMGKRWDESGIAFNQDFWEEVYRVLKPGAHLLAFGGTRTHHRMMVAIEDAGFEIRDTLMWVYGGGFPKNHDVSKAIDKKKGKFEEREVLNRKETKTGGFKSVSEKNVEHEYRPKEYYDKNVIKETTPATEEAKKWEGWGTALKPAHEPIVLARKPLSGTVVENVLKHSAGALNIDQCRVKTDWENDPSKRGFGHGFNSEDGGKRKKYKDKANCYGKFEENQENRKPDKGRWPANLLLDDRASVMLDEQSGKSKSNKRSPTGKKILDSEDGWNENSMKDKTVRGFEDEGGASRFFHTVENKGRYPANLLLDERASVMLDDQSGVLHARGNKNQSTSGGGTGNTVTPGEKHKSMHHDREILHQDGGASRFFYCPKANGDEDRHLGVEKNNHPTVKPIELMGYLVRLVTPKDGHVLDPFAGSGTTGIAAQLESVSCTLIEKDEESAEISKKRNEYVKANLPEVKRNLYEDPSNKITEEQTEVNDHSFW